MTLPKKRLKQLLSKYLGLNNNDIESLYKQTTGDDTLDLLHDLHEIRAIDADEIIDKIMEFSQSEKEYEVKFAKEVFRDFLETQSMITAWLATKEKQFMHDHTTNPFRVVSTENDDDCNDCDDQQDDIANKIEFAKMAQFKTSLFAALKDFDLLIRLVHYDALNFPKVCEITEDYYSNH